MPCFGTGRPPATRRAYDETATVEGRRQTPRPVPGRCARRDRFPGSHTGRSHGTPKVHRRATRCAPGKMGVLVTGSSRERLAEALRREFSRTEPPALDALSTGIARAIEARGIGTVPGANRPGKRWSRHAIDTLLDDKARTEEAQARREAERDAPPPPATTVELIKLALRVEVDNTAEESGADPAPTPALNSAALLRAALGGENGTINGVGS